jgi:hypothetical protein
LRTAHQGSNRACLLRPIRLKLDNEDAPGYLYTELRRSSAFE